MGRERLVNSAWLHLRRAEQLGRAIRRAIDASGQEEIELSVLNRPATNADWNSLVSQA